MCQALGAGDTVISPALTELNSLVGKAGFLQIIYLLHNCETVALVAVGGFGWVRGFLGRFG